MFLAAGLQLLLPRYPETSSLAPDSGAILGAATENPL
jgi:hypothetical protein